VPDVTCKPNAPPFGGVLCPTHLLAIPVPEALGCARMASRTTRLLRARARGSTANAHGDLSTDEPLSTLREGAPCPDSARRFRLGRAMTLRTVGFDGAGLRARARERLDRECARGTCTRHFSTIREGAPCPD
jgi:hypothetical protein